LLKQHPAAIDKVADTFYLSEGEKRLLLGAGQGEGLFFAGANHVAIRVVASEAEHNLITTNPAELLKLRERGLISGKAILEASNKPQAKPNYPPSSQPSQTRTNFNQPIIQGTPPKPQTVDSLGAMGSASQIQQQPSQQPAQPEQPKQPGQTNPVTLSPILSEDEPPQKPVYKPIDPSAPLI